MIRLNQEKLHGLSLTAAVQICAHPEIAVILGGSEDKRNPIDVIQAIIEDTFTTGLDYIPPAPAPLMIGLNLLDIQCICGHRLRNHYKDGVCAVCHCNKFDSGYVDENPVDSQSPSS
jgi:hypothetical protein